MRFRCFSPYDHFPNHNMVEGEPYINCYNDWYVKKVDSRPAKKVALLIEPRSLQPEIYRWMETNYERFDLVFTHDSILLSMIPNARLIIYGGVWDWADETIRFNKTKEIVEQRKIVQDRKKVLILEGLYEKTKCII